MAEFDWSKYEEKPEQKFDWSQYEERPQSDPGLTESKGFKGIASDALSGAASVPFSLLGNLMKLHGEFGGAVNQAFHEPKRALQNVGAGFGELGHGILSAPGNIKDYLVQKDIITPQMESYKHSFRLPESILPKEYNYAEAVGAHGEKPGDEFLRSVPTQLALSPLAEVGAGITSKIPKISSKGIAEKLLSDRAAIKNTYSKHYSDLFKEAENRGIKEISKPKINVKVIEDSGMPKYHKALKEFLDNPTLENAHWAQSSLGGLERRLEKVGEGLGLTPPQIKALDAAKKAKANIQEAMFAKHKLGSQTDLADLYHNISTGYKNEVIPWQSAKELHDFQRNELKASDLTKKLYTNKKFMTQLGKEYPQLKINQITRNPLLQSAAGGLLGLGALTKLHELYKSI